jgi:PAS domain S-box-containing protein
MSGNFTMDGGHAADNAAFRALMESAPDAIFLVRDGRFVWVNAAAVTLYGAKAPEELLETDSLDRVAPEFRAEVIRRRQRQIDTGRAVPSVEMDHLRVDGSRVPVETSAVAVPVEGGTGHLVFLRDISARKAAEAAVRAAELAARENDRRLRTFIDFTTDWEYWRRPDGHHEYVSPACERITGYPPQAFADDPHLVAAIVHPEDRAGFDAHVCASLDRHPKPMSMDLRIVHKDGQVRWIQHACQPVVQDDGGFAGTRVSNRDITDRRRFDLALAASEARFREIFTESPIAIEVYDAQGRLLEINRACLDLFGVVDQTEIVGFNLFEDPTLPADTKERLARHETVRYECTFDFEKVKSKALYRTKRSGVAHLDVSIARLGSPVAPYCYLVQVLDVTERKRAEEGLRESESRYKLLFDAIPESVLVIGTDGRVITANWASARLYGYESPEQLKGFPTPLLIAERDRKRATQTQADVIRGKEPPVRRYTEVRRDGSEFIAEVTSTTLRGPQQEVVGYIGITRDITALVTAERLLQESEKNYRSIFDNSTEGIFQTTAEGRFIRTNPALAAMLGFDSVAEMIAASDGRSANLYCHPEDRRRILALLEQDGRVTNFEVQMRRKDGYPLWVSMNVHQVLGGDGQLAHLEGTLTDIDGRKKSEQALQVSQDKLQKIFAHAPSGISVSHLGRSEFVECNPAFCRIVGYSREELLGKSPLALNLWKNPADRGRLLPALLEKGTLQIDNLEVLDKNGNERIVSAHFSVVEIAGEKHSISVFSDITEIKKAEAERVRLETLLREAQKMEAVGTLAGGVAHDFNNILGGVMSGLSLLEIQLGELGDPHRADLKDMMELVQRGAELSHQLLGFSRRGKYDVAPRDLREVVRKTAELFGRTRRDITLILDFVDDLDRVLVDHAQLEQVLLNLFINAAHAMPDGGRLAIRGENVTLTQAETDPYGAKPGRFVRLVVADTGTGIDPTILPRIFEPFFTTKAPGLGTGLGLASVYGIVKNHGGMVTVESEVGKGTTFTVLLPATDRPSADRPASRAAVRPGQGTILIVDDEEQLLGLCGRLLCALGYQALTASGGRAALELVRQHGDKISLVILDMTMPEMSGAATFDAIRKIVPTMKVLLASGFAVDGQAQALLDRGCVGFIQKPFDAAELSKRIRTLG